MGPALLAPSIRICYSVMRLQRKMLMDMLPAIMVMSMNVHKVIHLKE